MYNYRKKLIIGIIENISALNTVRMTGNLDDVAMVDKPVNDCVGNNSDTENIGSFWKRLIGGEYGRSVFISCGNKLKETKCSSLINRQKTDFVLWEVYYEKYQ